MQKLHCGWKKIHSDGEPDLEVVEVVEVVLLF